FYVNSTKHTGPKFSWSCRALDPPLLRQSSIDWNVPHPRSDWELREDHTRTISCPFPFLHTFDFSRRRTLCIGHGITSARMVVAAIGAIVIMAVIVASDV